MFSVDEEKDVTKYQNGFLCSADGHGEKETSVVVEETLVLLCRSPKAVYQHQRQRFQFVV